MNCLQTRATASAGILEINPTTQNAPHWVVACAMKPGSEGVNGRVSDEDNKDAIKYSFHDARKVNIAAAPRPGRTAGNTEKKNAPRRVLQSIWAAISISTGTSAKNPSSNQTTNAKLKLVCVTMTAK